PACPATPEQASTRDTAAFRPALAGGLCIWTASAHGRRSRCTTGSVTRVRRAVGRQAPGIARACLADHCCPDPGVSGETEMPQRLHTRPFAADPHKCMFSVAERQALTINSAPQSAV